MLRRAAIICQSIRGGNQPADIIIILYFAIIFANFCSAQVAANNKDGNPAPDVSSIPARPNANKNLPQPLNKRSIKGTELDFAGQHSAEYSLYQRLLGSSRYQKHVRPVRDHHQPVKVKVGMCVMMIEEIIERDQIMTMAACIKMKWTDDFLVWKPDNYDNLTWLAISSSNIWLPDIAIINSPEPYELTRKSTNVDVDFRGEVGFFPSGRLATRCNLQITYFPFDWQHCEVRLESWIYPTQYLEIEMYPDDTVDLKEYYTNHQWAVAGYRVLPEVADYDGKNFSSITFTFILRRKSEYYFMYFIFPQLLLALLQTLSHTLPVEHPGRMAMLTSLFIGTSVTQAGIAVHIPKSSDSMSLLQIYMTIMSCNLVVALVVTFVMMYAVLRYPNEEPSFIGMMVAFFSIVWPSEADKHHLHHHNPAPVYHRRQSVAVRRTSSPYVERAEEMPTKGSTSTRRRTRSPPSKERKSPHASRDQSQQDGTERRSKSKQNQGVSSTGFQEQAVSNKRSGNQSRSPGLDRGDMTDFRKIVQKQNQSPSFHNRCPPESVKRLTFAGDHSEGEEFYSFNDSQYVNETRSRPGSFRQAGGGSSTMPRATFPNGSVPSSRNNNANNDPSLKMSYINKRGQPFVADSSPDMMGIGSDFSPMNPNVHSPHLNPSFLESGSIARQLAAKNDKLNSSSLNTPMTPTEPSVGFIDDGRDIHIPHRPLKRQRSTRGEAASADETRELKRRWLLYCVALDKTIMYVNLVWNIIVPLVLFAIVPVLSPHPFLHVTTEP